ncbi:MAG: toll/interleukin-1 receptor domain-containing protein [candidate division KSB1 bacterium]|nr:toll/interleukin-1 receptor domain-containing protein [candidate division KSB1 bacterium]
MPQAFLSHSTKDKQLVLKVRDHLENSLVYAWIDQSSIPGGGSMIQSIMQGIGKSKYFLAFLSNDYLQSNWCFDELEQAYGLHQDGKVTIIPILLESQDQLDLKSLSDPRRAFWETVFKRIKYVEFDRHNVAKSLNNVAEALWRNELIRFEPIRMIKVDGVELQVVEFKIPGSNLPVDFLRHWDLKIEDFIATSPNEQKPIKFDVPVALYGPGPNWLYSFLTLPFKNRNTVFVFNSRTSEYICVYSKSAGIEPGMVLK